MRLVVLSLPGQPNDLGCLCVWSLVPLGLFWGTERRRSLFTRPLRLNCVHCVLVFLGCQPFSFSRTVRGLMEQVVFVGAIMAMLATYFIVVEGLSKSRLVHDHFPPCQSHPVPVPASPPRYHQCNTAHCM